MGISITNLYRQKLILLNDITLGDLMKLLFSLITYSLTGIAGIGASIWLVEFLPALKNRGFVMAEQNSAVQEGNESAGLAGSESLSPPVPSIPEEGGGVPPPPVPPVPSIPEGDGVPPPPVPPVPSIPEEGGGVPPPSVPPAPEASPFSPEETAQPLANPAAPDGGGSASDHLNPSQVAIPKEWPALIGEGEEAGVSQGGIVAGDPALMESTKAIVEINNRIVQIIELMNSYNYDPRNKVNPFEELERPKKLEVIEEEEDVVDLNFPTGNLNIDDLELIGVKWVSEPDREHESIAKFRYATPGNVSVYNLRQYDRISNQRGIVYKIIEDQVLVLLPLATPTFKEESGEVIEAYEIYPFKLNFKYEGDSKFGEKGNSI